MTPEVEAAAAKGLLTYKGRLERESLHSLLAEASVTVSAQSSLLERNRYAGLPFKVTESLMLGVPVVASDTAGQRRTVRECPAGWVYSDDDPEQLNDCLKRSVTVPLEKRVELSSWAAEHLSWGRVVEETEGVLLPLVSRRRQRNDELGQ
ncbi:hypothetical protein GCM10028820_14090 [Tessaracoccus terricola]